jgi:tetratricopeptide (TPR) repeat protein
VLRGLLDEERGRWDDAADAYAAAASARPHDPVAAYNLARALDRLGRPAQALSALDAYLALAPGDGEARAWRARLAR